MNRGNGPHLSPILGAEMSPDGRGPNRIGETKIWSPLAAHVRFPDSPPGCKRRRTCSPIHRMPCSHSHRPRVAPPRLPAECSPGRRPAPGQRLHSPQLSIREPLLGLGRRRRYLCDAPTTMDASRSFSTEVLVVLDVAGAGEHFGPVASQR